jgi:hypothetical protein
MTASQSWLLHSLELLIAAILVIFVYVWLSGWLSVRAFRLLDIEQRLIVLEDAVTEIETNNLKLLRQINSNLEKLVQPVVKQ